MKIKCACGEMNCVIGIRIEDNRHMWLIGKDGQESLMYMCNKTWRELLEAVEINYVESRDQSIEDLRKLET